MMRMPQNLKRMMMIPISKHILSTERFSIYLNYDIFRLWCICRQPHNNRFMICCDLCEDWYHGTCVSVTKAMGLEMEQKGIDWKCPKCVKKQEEKVTRNSHIYIFIIIYWSRYVLRIK